MREECFLLGVEMEKFASVPMLFMLLRHYESLVESAEVGIKGAKQFESLFLGDESFSIRAGMVYRSATTMRQYVLDLLHKEASGLQEECTDIVHRSCESVDLPLCTAFFRFAVSLRVNGGHFLLCVQVTLRHTCSFRCTADTPLQEYLPLYMEQCRELITAQLNALQIPVALSEFTVTKT